MEVWRKNLYALSALTFVSLAGQTSVMPFLPFYIREIGLPPGHSLEMWSGLIYSISLIFICIMGPIWGVIGDRFGHRVNINRAVIGITVLLVLMAFARTVYDLLFLRIFWGILVGFSPASMALMSNITPKEKLGVTLGILQTSLIAGTIAGPFLGGILADTVGYRNVFLVIGALHLVCVGIGIFFVREDKTVRREREGINFFYNLKNIVNSSSLRAMFVSLLIMYFSVMIVQPVFSLFIEDLAKGRTKYIASLTGIIFASTSITHFIFTPFWGRKGDREGYKNILVKSLLFAGILFFPQSFVQNPYQLLFIRILLGIFIAGIIPTAYTIIAKSTSPERNGMVFGLASTSTAMGGAIGTFSGGLIATVIGIRPIFTLTAIVLVMTSIWIQVTVKEHSELK